LVGSVKLAAAKTVSVLPACPTTTSPELYTTKESLWLCPVKVWALPAFAA